MSAYPCYVHSSEETRFYCKVCQRRICDDCVVTECKQHLLERTRSETDVKKSAIKQKLETVNRAKNQTVENFRTKMASVDEDIERVPKRTEELKNILEKLCQKTLQELRKSKEEMEKYFTEIERKIQEKEQFAVESLKKLGSMNEDELDEVDARMKVLENIELSFLKSTPPTFVDPVGKDDTIALKAIFGYVQLGLYEEVVLPVEHDGYLLMSPKPPEIPKSGRYEEVVLPDDEYLPMNPKSPEVPKRLPGRQSNFTAKVVLKYNLGIPLCHFIEKNDEFLVTEKSKLLKIKPEKEKQPKELVDINETIRGIVRSNENLFLMTSSMVYKLESKSAKTKKCKVSNFIDPHGLLLACIGNTVSGDSLLLGLKITGDDAFELRRYPMGEKGCLEFEKLVLPREVQIPLISHVAENTNGDICALVKDEVDSSFFVCFDSDGVLRYRYPKDEKLKRKFLGIGILKDGMIALSDGCALSGIHFLNKDGCQVHFERRRGPLPMCIVTDFNDHVWVGFDDGTVEEIKVNGTSSFS